MNIHPFTSRTHRDKLEMANEKWKRKRPTHIARLTNQELLEAPLDEQYFQRLDRTFIEVNPKEFIGIEVSDIGRQNLLMAVVSRIFQNYPVGFLVGPRFRKFLSSREFYHSKIHDLDIFDLCCLHHRHDFTLHILETIPPEWRKEFILERKDRLPALMNVFLYNVFDEEIRLKTLDILRSLVSAGLDPNLELSSPLSNTCPPYEDSLTEIIEREGLTFDEVRPLVRYAGTTRDDYHRALRESEYVRKLDITLPEESVANKLTGDTVFGVLLQNSRSAKHRKFLSNVLRSNLIYMNTVLNPYKYRQLDGVKTYPTISLLSGSLRHMDELSSILFEDTPPYMFYITNPSQKPRTGYATNPMVMTFKPIKTCWDGFLRTSPVSAPALAKMLTGGFCIPRENLFWKIHMWPFFADHVRGEIVKNYFQNKTKPIFENLLQSCEERGIDPLKTCLSGLFVYPPVLKRVLREGLDVMKNQSYVSRQFQSYRETVIAGISTLCQSNNPGVDYVNESFLLGEEPVQGSGKLVFRTEDNYAFEPRDWQFLLEKKYNPYTRRELTESEKSRLVMLRDIVDHSWVVLSRNEIPYADFLEQEDRRLQEMYIEKIDEYMDMTELVNYGPRLRDQIAKLENPEVLIKFYKFLFQNPCLISFGSDTDTTFSHWLVSFSQSPVDPPDLGEIAAYYASRTRNSPSEAGYQEDLVNILGHVYNVLETTLEHGRRDRFVGRVLFVYYLVDNYLRTL